MLRSSESSISTADCSQTVRFSFQIKEQKKGESTGKFFVFANSALVYERYPNVIRACWILPVPSGSCPLTNVVSGWFKEHFIKIVFQFPSQHFAKTTQASTSSHAQSWMFLQLPASTPHPQPVWLSWWHFPVYFRPETEHAPKRGMPTTTAYSTTMRSCPFAAFNPRWSCWIFYRNRKRNNFRGLVSSPGRPCICQLLLSVS